MRELIEINSVQVQGRMEGPRQVCVLTLGVDGDTTGEKVSILLGQWGADAIMDQLRMAGVTGSVQEQPVENEMINAADIIDI